MMKVFYGFDHKFDRAVVAVGSFDGVHRGHRLLIEQINDRAQAIGGQAVILTFDPHPRQVLRGENRLLSTIDERLVLLDQAGAQNVVVVNFTHEFSQIAPEVFVGQYLIDSLGAVAVFTGQGHSFGRDRGGDERFLSQFPLEIYHLDRFENISSTAVRLSVQCGDMDTAAQLLGAPYLIITPITQNSKLLPPHGEYLCSIDGQNEVIKLSEIKKMTEKRIICVKSV